MAYVGFSDYGYECFDAGNYLRFSEDNSHKFLFHYVTQDLSRLSLMFAQYISQRMDITTFTLHSCPGEDTTDQMKNVLVNAHPYYKHEVKRVLIMAIGDYFNNLLLYSCYHQRMAPSRLSEVWYIERITNLLEPLLEMGDTYPQDFYNEYQKQIGGDIYTAGQPDTEIETFICDIPQEMPIGFSGEIRMQSEIYNMLYFLLDISASGLDELTIPQRIWLYGNITSSSGTAMTVPKHLSLMHPTLYQDGIDNSQLVKNNREIDKKLSPLHGISKLNIGRDGIPAGMNEGFRSAIDYAKTVTTAKPYEEYEISSLHQLLYLEILSMIRDKVMIRKCGRCGKYFVVTNRKTAYCDRTDEFGIRCSVVGSQQAFRKKMETDAPLKMYTRAYKTHHARIRKGNMSKEDFELWYSEAKLKLAKVRTGELDVVSFQKWLKK